MLSFYNYYGIDKENNPEKYDVVFRNNLLAMLCHVKGADSQEALAQRDLASAATAYLLNSGMAEEEILALKEKLN